MHIKMNIHGAYNLVHIRKGNEWKTMFKIHYGHFEYTMMPFGLINALVVFQHLMNNVFCELLGNFMVCYIDDIFIFLINLEDHECQVCLILEKLWELEKCEFHQFEVEFLGYNMSRHDIHMDPCNTNRNLVICN
jgi:hypothetical protein